ncbi:MAG: NADH-quinone oxidoreductase subunit N, partial [Candidatus Acidiferrales bacterium]
MRPPLEDVCRLAPEIMLCFTGILIMLVDPLVSAKNKKFMGWLGFAGAVAAVASICLAARYQGPAYGGLILTDQFSLYMHAVVTGAAALAILGSFAYFERENLVRGEYYSLILFATAGMGILCGAGELVTAFIGLEMSSISSYILAGFRRDAVKSNEASLKYFLLGSFATSFFLYGTAMIYGATGTTRFDGIENAVARPGAGTLLVLGLVLLFVGLGFKIVAAPFQIYAPDVYEGAPTPVSALLSSGPKAATFAVMLRIFYVAFGNSNQIWYWAIWIAAVLSMCVGNFGALVQTNVKRMLAYSSIAHAGYILVAFAASTKVGIAAVLFYLAAYALMKLGAFVVVAQLGVAGEKRLELKDYAGLSTQQPWLAACFALLLFSLLGIPGTGGFLGKFYAFQAPLLAAREAAGMAAPHVASSLI